MKNEKFTSRFSGDLLLAGLFILIGAAGCYAYFHYHDSFSGFGSGPELGELKSQEPTGVRYRTGSSMIWQDVAKKQTISAGDAVFTGTGASTKVMFKNQVETTIGPDSLVVFNAPTEEMRARFPQSRAVLSVQKGTVKLNIAAEGEPMLIESGGKVFSMPLKTGSVDLHVDSETGKLEAKTETGESFALKEEPVIAKVAEVETPKAAEKTDAAPFAKTFQSIVADAVTAEAKPTTAESKTSGLSNQVLTAAKHANAKREIASVSKPVELRTPASEAPMLTGVPALDSAIFTPKVSYGVSSTHFSQNGAFGKGSGSAMSVSVLEAGLEFKAGDWGACAEFSRYALDFQVNAASSLTTTNKTFQDILIEGSFKKILLGIHAKTAPVLAIVSASDVRFLDFTTMSVIAGYRFENESTTDAGKILQMSLDLNAELPFTGSSSALAGVMDVNKVSGFGAKATGRISKSLTRVTPDANVRLYIGLEASAGFTRTQTDATLSTLSGTSTRDIQEYQALMQLRLEF